MKSFRFTTRAANTKCLEGKIALFFCYCSARGREKFPCEALVARWELAIHVFPPHHSSTQKVCQIKLSNMLECKLHASLVPLSSSFVRLFSAVDGNEEKKSFTFLKDSPSGMSVRRQVAAKAPAEAPEIFCSSNCGAYFLKATATPTGKRHFE